MLNFIFIFENREDSTSSACGEQTMSLHILSSCPHAGLFRATLD